MSIPDTQEPRWREYLFRRHSPAELRAWGRRLRYFRFCKAYGGHANDGDQLLAALRYADPADLHQLLTQLGLPVVPIENPVVFPAAGQVTLAGERVFVWVRKLPVPQLEISVVDLENLYEVTPRAVAAAEAIEKLLLTHEARIIDPPLPGLHCVCPAYYPELWA
ncbi:hypothetical protein [Hymenobacter sp. IS2118]|uniref:hypothetical protein n=1 Tax=Hymenobacter sp. IS2118 TaxID=1505605 RepID=UPI0005532682|nr:hypothetical protein [Hymenobacter sp. IS2118]